MGKRKKVDDKKKADDDLACGALQAHEGCRSAVQFVWCKAEGSTKPQGKGGAGVCGEAVPFFFVFL